MLLQPRALGRTGAACPQGGLILLLTVPPSAGHSCTAKSRWVLELAEVWGGGPAHGSHYRRSLTSHHFICCVSHGAGPYARVTGELLGQGLKTPLTTTLVDVEALLSRGGLQQQKKSIRSTPCVRTESPPIAMELLQLYMVQLYGPAAQGHGKRCVATAALPTSSVGQGAA